MTMPHYGRRFVGSQTPLEANDGSGLRTSSYTNSLSKPGKELLTDEFQALFIVIVLKTQIEYQVLDSSRAKLFDLRGTVIGISYDQQPFQIFDRLKLSRWRLNPVARALRAFCQRRNVYTCAGFLSVFIDARDRDIAQSNFSVGQLS